MTIQEMRDRKKELGLSNEALAKLSGVPFSTVQKIFSGATDSPRQRTLQALERVLRKEERSGMYYSNGSLSQPGRVQEAAPAYGKKRRGEYTLEDYYAIPDERRVELIDGEIFDMAAPSLTHQTILGELHLQFRACADAHGKDCRVFLSPCDVQLDNDDKTMVQPDLFVVCTEFDRTKRCFSGAPDLTVEILSDSTRAKDMLLKTYKYKNAGVREYWIIDPKEERVQVYDFSDESLTPKSYPFTERIPIAISGGKCEIDFGRIKDRL
ncbi:MAG: Uma2 family endonuclease [Blautia sp.]|nr:Uma2 family endonuclease [Blautia sp.]